MSVLAYKALGAKNEGGDIERHDDPDEDFDRDLFLPFAWRQYEKLFARELNELCAIEATSGHEAEDYELAQECEYGKHIEV